MTEEEYKKNLQRQEQLNNQWVDLAKKQHDLLYESYRNQVRMLHPDKSDEELGLNQPFAGEHEIDFWEGEVNRFENFIDKIKNFFFRK